MRFPMILGGLLAAFALIAAEFPAWPEEAGKPALTLEFSAGKVLNCDAESTVNLRPDHLSVRRPGHSPSKFTVAFPLPDGFPGGEYAVWLLYNTGGVDSWKLDFEQYNAAAERKFSSSTPIRNRTSWKLEYCRAAAPVILRAGLPELRLTVDGRSAEAKNLYRLCLVPAPGKAPEEPPLPADFAGKPLLTLEGGLLAAPLEHARQLTGELVGHTPEAAARQQTYEATVQRKGHSESGMTLRYELPADFPGGEFKVAALYNTGGIAGLNFEFKQFDPAGKLLAEEKCLLRNRTSWKMEYTAAASTVKLAPGAGSLELSLSGRSGDAKNLRRVLLLPLGDRAALTPEQALLRQRLLALDRSGAKKKLILLEADDPAAADRLFAALLAAAPASGVSAEYRAGKAATELKERLNLRALPAAVLTDDREVVLGALDAADRAAAFFTTPATAGYLPAPEPDPVALRELGQIMLGAGVWAGPAGISILGLETEAELAPQEGDLVPVMRFDPLFVEQWKALRPGANGRFTVEEKSVGLAWSRGSAYAFCYLVNDQAAELELTVTQSGSETMLWLDGKLQAPVSAQRLRGERRSVEGVTDQGNVFAVEQQNAGSATGYRFALKPGSHRLLIKLIMEHQRGETFDFSLAFRGDTGKVKAALADPAGRPELHRTLNRLSQQITVNAPANLPDPGEPLTITTRLALPRQSREWPKPPAPGEAVTPVTPFPAELVQQVEDYDGRTVREFRSPVTVPGEYVWNFGPAPEMGYYTIRTSLYTPDGKLIGKLYPDGFSVIGNAGSRRGRQDQLKLMSSYYWLNENDVDGITDWLARVGIYHNVGSGNQYNPAVRAAFERKRLTLTADFIDTWSSASREQRFELAKQWSSFTDKFKALNEIDIFKEGRPSPEKWVARTREEYEAVKAADPNAEFTGGSLVRVATDRWFEECLKLGLDRYVDRWDVHAYPKTPPRLGDRYMSNSRNEDAQGVEQVYARLGRTNPKPFIMGETGARCSHGVDARRWQADTMPKMLAWALARQEYSGIAFLVPWLRSSTGGDIPIARHPAEAAVYVAGILIDGYVPQPLAGFPPHLEVARFGETVMAWSAGRPEKIKLNLEPGLEYVKVDVVGRAAPFVPGAELEVTASPVYLLPRAVWERLIRR